MFEFLGGLAMLAAGIFLVLHFRARGGKLHRWVKLPGMETTIALVIVCALAGGIAMTVASVLR